MKRVNNELRISVIIVSVRGVNVSSNFLECVGYRT